MRASLEESAVGRTRLADILVQGWDRGSSLAIDLTIAHPLQQKFHPLDLGKVERFLKGEEVRKITAEKDSCDAVGWIFRPAAFTPWGGCGPAARDLLFESGRRAVSDLTGATRSLRLREISQDLSLTLARQVAGQLDLRCRVQDLLGLC